MITAEKALGQCLHKMAPEIETEYHDNVHDRVEYDYYEADVKSVEFFDDEDDPWIAVFLRCIGQFTEKVAAATRYPNSKAHPAEYETHEVELEILVEFYPLRGQFGEATIDVDQFGSLPIDEPLYDPEPKR